MTDRADIRQEDDNYESHERDVAESTRDVTDGQTLPPDQALSVLTNETRIEILRVLAATDEEVVPFSTLRKRVGIDDSGRFNYHLNRLSGHYVHHTSDGYTLRQSGINALEAIARLCGR